MVIVNIMYLGERYFQNRVNPTLFVYGQKSEEKKCFKIKSKVGLNPT